MKYCRFAVTVFALAIVVIPGAAQTKKNWTPPRTSYGVPDLQGIWNSSTLTPFERPKEYAGKEFFTPQEAEAFAKEELYRVDGDRRDGGGGADVGRAYNEFWRDRGKLSPDLRTSMIVDPPDGRIPPLTPQAQKLVAERRAANRGHDFDGPENRSLAERCIQVRNAGPPMIPTNYNSNYQIVQSPGYVALLSEQIHDVRVIPTDGRPHAPSSVRLISGDSVGHWEGNTLVVETTNFTDRTAYENSGEHMKLVERFTLTGPETLMYEFTVNDPESFTKPWTARYPMMRTEDKIFEYACHEGNYGLSGSLSGARAQEKAAAANRGSK
ncbi:MAG: hypothetical protein C5B51_11670 [Terriglobia bacterium]|nr:MAG: hypothetical protein C5B51_11670 [Terriglobia bacterium]